ncbi:PTS sugar transporter subunit IIA [Oceanobacillus damuensis]|uniref:PTS sugar transporter subunit IIA n=1 Tax=Oceanobacillus damuensis TaxID=937928 RepID=UPI0018FE7107|nr:PTS sugar transporter subunit IIA [Oceanobacillus damuensis]
MKTEDYFNEKLTFLIEENEQKQVLEKLADELHEKGYVKETFKQAVLDREEKFPTGLLIDGIGVAIPHTDSIHVNKATIAVCILKEPVLFQHMVAKGEVVQVHLIFMLVIQDSSNQVHVLQSIINLLQDRQVINKMMKATSKTDIVTMLKDYTRAS